MYFSAVNLGIYKHFRVGNHRGRTDFLLMTRVSKLGRLRISVDFHVSTSNQILVSPTHPWNTEMG